MVFSDQFWAGMVESSRVVGGCRVGMLARLLWVVAIHAIAPNNILSAVTFCMFLKPPNPQI